MTDRDSTLGRIPLSLLDVSEPPWVVELKRRRDEDAAADAAAAAAAGVSAPARRGSLSITAGRMRLLSRLLPNPSLMTHL